VGQQLLAHVLVPLGGFGVVADDEPVAGVVEGDFLDLHVVGDGGVAALPGQGLLRFGRTRA
jgi:hypothetical protein